MEIHKLDPEKAREEAEKQRLKKKLERSIRLADATPTPLELWKNIPKRRLLTYGILVILLFSTSLVYNLLHHQKASRPVVTGTPQSADDLSSEFYDLCSDLEDQKEENGSYPDTIREMLFSDHLIYRKNNDGSYVLIFNDGENKLVFDSRTNMDMIK